MKIDLYTKFVLTVIAVSLTWIGFQQTINNAIAQDSSLISDGKPIKVAICNVKGSRCADIAFGGKVEVDVD